MKRSKKILKITRRNPFFTECDHLSKISKQLYNVGLFILKQALIKENRWVLNKELYEGMKQNENWVLLPRKVSNQVWSQVCKNWKSWLQALKVYKRNPSVFFGRPRMPKYKSSRNIVIYEKGAIGKNDQKFVQIPHARLIELIKYKFEEIGGEVLLTEESYTSKASALDLDELPTYEKGKFHIFSGKRVKRGLYKTSKGYSINGALNIMRKVIRNSVDDLISDKQFYPKGIPIHNCTSPSFLEINQ